MLASWKKGYDQPKPHIKKQRHYFADKGPSSQRYGFSSSHVWMWELDHKESRALKNWCFWTVVLEKTLESLLDCKEIQPVNPKGNQSWIFIGKTDAKAETPILWPSDAKNWLIRKNPDAGKRLKAGGEGDNRGWDGWMASQTQWHEFEQAPGDGEGQGSLACCSPWGCKESDTTEWLNNNPLLSVAKSASEGKVCSILWSVATPRMDGPWAPAWHFEWHGHHRPQRLLQAWRFCWGRQSGVWTAARRPQLLEEVQSYWCGREGCDRLCADDPSGVLPGAKPPTHLAWKLTWASRVKAGPPWSDAEGKRRHWRYCVCPNILAAMQPCSLHTNSHQSHRVRAFPSGPVVKALHWQCRGYKISQGTKFEYILSKTVNQNFKLF